MHLSCADCGDQLDCVALRAADGAPPHIPVERNQAVARLHLAVGVLVQPRRRGVLELLVRFLSGAASGAATDVRIGVHTPLLEHPICLLLLLIFKSGSMHPFSNIRFVLCCFCFYALLVIGFHRSALFACRCACRGGSQASRSFSLRTFIVC